ncbi:hypothetical protein BRADI_3g03236v3 [Brachypodium distachyon]|uniref:F-box domain-containing protein n=1 Tax=Brachypodium distachyon TaxID=15368 RepID=A0A2K2CUX9_BRADI|nr:hypothetical protein BRADI_3g03236v3 [Brachypodium distachyon]PNT65828.1 hypothetical protein BRADI_3g03236v3 [Brachypodium distachyon]
MAPGMAPATTRLFDEILEEIFLRLPSPEDLARAATASPAFRRIITSRPFLRRFRELHPPPLLGFVTEGGTFQPATDPHHSAPLARAFAAAADFKYAGFVPKPDGGDFTDWTHRDVRDGRVLLMCTRRRSTSTTAGVRHDPLSLTDKVFTVCDPVSRRSVLLPPIPVLDSALQKEHGFVHESGHKLVPAAAGDDVDDRDFRVICWASYVSSFVIFVFLSAAGRWCLHMHHASREDNLVIVLDTSTMEFSTATILFRRHMLLMDICLKRE